VPAADTEADAGSGSSAERSLRLLSLLANEGRALSLADLAARLALPKGTAHRICTQLLAGGFLARDVDERSFVVGPALRRLAFDTLNHGVVRGQRHDVLAALVGQVGETCNFTTLDGTQVLYLDRVEAQWPLRLTLDEVRVENRNRRGLALDRQPEEQLALQSRQARELLIQHVADVVEDRRLVAQERRHIAREQVVDRGGHQLERQRIARVTLDQRSMASLLAQAALAQN